MRNLRRLQFLVRVFCTAGFCVSLIVPTYVPQAVSSGDLPMHYLVSDQFLLVEEGFVMKTASISEQGHRLAYSQGIAHTVSENESLNSIADFYNISTETIRWANNLTGDAVIYPGQSLFILPVDGVLHTVKRGQGLLKVAALYNVPLESLMQQNQLSSERIYAGQQIIIPNGTPLLIEGTSGEPVSVVARPSIAPEPPKPTQPPEAAPPPSYGIFQKPCDCTYTQYFRPGHYAIDMSRNGGGPIFAAEDGIVIRADFGWNGGYGNVVEIDHGNGLVTLYAHNRKIHVHEGAVVRRGDVIATMGNTGRVYGQTGVHVHFETILHGVKKNPLLYLQ